MNDRPRQRNNKATERIRFFVLHLAGPFSPKDIMDSLNLEPDKPGVNLGQVQTVLWRLKNEGTIQRVRNGRYVSGRKES